MSRRLKIVLVVLIAALLLLVIGTAYEGFQTLKRLDVIEAERDQWQRPSDILRVLDLTQGNTAVDFGSGSGYFALKLSSAVGPSGKVLAVDIRRLSLTFLWFRALMKHQRNIHVMPVQSDDPKLLPGSVNAVLILNTYHELENRPPILNQIFQSLVSGGRLVIVDPMETDHGELPPAVVEEELRSLGFEIVSRDDQFNDQPAGRPWWLIVARKP